MRWIRRLVVVIVLLAIAAAGALFLIPTERIAGIAARQFETATGRRLQLSGDLSPTLWPVIGVTSGPVEIANADWSDAGPMIRAEGLVIGLQAMPLVSGRIELRELRIDRPQILLERHADGRTNWDLGRGQPEGAAVASGGGTAGGAPDLHITVAEIAGGLIRYADHATGEEIVLSDTDLRIRMPDLAGETRLEGSARLNGVPVTLDATIDGPGPLLDGAVRPVKLALTAAANKIGFDGRAGMKPPAADGRLEADLPEPATLLALAGQAAPDLPAGLGRERVTLSGAVTLTDGDRLFLREGSVGLDANRLRAEADLSLGGARPRLVARLSANTLDLSGLASGGGGAAGDSGGAGWPTEAIEVSGLGAADAEIALTAGGISFGDFAIGATDLVARLENARLAIEIRQISAFEGALSGEVVVNGRAGLSVGVDLAATGMQLRPMLAALADYDRLLGPVGARAKLLGSGASVDAIMRSLSGEGRIDIGQGELQGLDIAGMLRNLDTSYRGPGAKTVFNAITGSFTIAGGVLRNEDLRFDAPLVPATGQGQADIGRQTVKYRLTPVALGSRDGDTLTGGVRVPVLIEGAWSNPSIRPDLENMLQGEIGARKEEVKQKVQEEIGKRLNIEAVEGEKAGDTLKRGVEEKAKDALQGIFGGKKN